MHGERLDVLINNAGVHLDLMSAWKEPRLTDDGFEIQWRTNYLGTMHLTHELRAALETTAGATGEARVVNVVSSLLSSERRPAFDAKNREEQEKSRKLFEHRQNRDR